MLKTDEIIDFFKLESSHAKKELGQNFLINEEVIKHIVSSLDTKENEKILEIGPGLGALTGELVKITDNLTVVEYDAKFVNFLSKAYENNNINIVKGNFLTFKDYSFEYIIGNLPYYITTDILEYIFVKFNNFKKGVFMVQNEALNRILAKDGKDFNAINVLVNLTYNVEKLFIVKKDSFFPMPNVDSVVFKIEKKENVDNLFSLAVYKVAQNLFKLRRKTINNNLKSLVKDSTTLNEILNLCNLSPNLRAEELKVDDFVNLTNELLKLKIIKL